MIRPPFRITPKILSLSNAIQELLGEFKSHVSAPPLVTLRRESKIKTIRHSLAIEGNTLTEKQITALIDNKRVIGPQKQILEVKNALNLYEKISDFDARSEKDFLKCHKILMAELVSRPGFLRSGAVGIFKGDKVSRIAPPAKRVPMLVSKLFAFIKNDKEISWLLKACVIHYEVELIHPFEDGNGRMGRLWQQLLLMRHSPIFEYVSIESLIHKNQKAYYRALEHSDVAGESTEFIEFSLELILQSLQQFNSTYRPVRANGGDRIQSALVHFKGIEFSRSDYLTFHKGISTATASRDLARAVADKLLIKSGDKALARYRKR